MAVVSWNERTILYLQLVNLLTTLNHGSRTAPELAKCLLELAWCSGGIAKSDLGTVGCESRAWKLKSRCMCHQRPPTTSQLRRNSQKVSSDSAGSGRFSAIHQNKNSRSPSQDTGQARSVHLRIRSKRFADCKSRSRHDWRSCLQCHGFKC